MKHSTIIGNIDILPAGKDEAGDIKELIIHDPDSGEVIHYKMTEELAKNLARKLKANNDFLLDEVERAQARARLVQPGQNGAGIPLSSEVQADIRRRTS